MNLPSWAQPAPLQPLNLGWLHAARIQVAILRLDLIDPLVSGNKWFKLSEHLVHMRDQGMSGVMSLGGAHSNHLHALAAAGKRLDFKTVGLMCGHAQHTPTVDDLQAFGMQLHWLGYGGYRERHAPGFWAPWRAQYPDLLAVPEGGGGVEGARGCRVLLDQVREQLPALGWDDFDGWWLAVGTGTTLAGLVMAGGPPVYGALAVPPGHGVPENVQAIVGDAGGYELMDASRGGFAKVDEALLAFMGAAEEEGRVPLEPLYTGKALLALQQHLHLFAPGTRLVFIHTGGLQGRRGFNTSFRKRPLGSAFL
ncbi:1-aminocyclopropane-1-carboxylate deaminase [Pseudomonas sp. M47T1]|uniref:1-aminocyclopropane-1-carboxylate deaminase/D-cysteine desulfhydrase n=1 Tax=Pseudomonas sp. M47T1 TaxID=1179778 RepID=UPI00026086A3|nr:pyridoxal-phosphate dependent enzyme [Pseudomonas sp. M47T1]EIK93235.1 1-aminocyclopropane-1-carboxylate deaminase [Pseudomonas sp. M47T1]